MEVGLEAARARAWALAAELRARLAELDGVRILDRGAELCAIVTAAVDGHPAAELVAGLREQGINTSAVERTSAVLDLADKGALSALRLSPHYFNTEAELRATVGALEGLTG
jgi:selenocysteine lyase/cysteine desulfurase